MNTYKIVYRRFAEINPRDGDVYEIKAKDEKAVRVMAENRISTEFQKTGFPYPKVQSITLLEG